MKNHFINWHMCLFFLFAICFTTVASAQGDCSVPIVSASGLTTFCQGSDVLLSTSATDVTYQWQKDGVDISGATASSYTANATGNYRVVVTNISNCSSVSAVTSVTVNPYPANRIATSARNYCGGIENVVTVNDNPGTVSFVYPPEITGGAFTPVAPGVYLQYVNVANVTSQVVTSIGGNTILNGCTTSVTVPVTINPTPAITSAPQVSRCFAGTVTLNAIATAGNVNWYTAPVGGSAITTGTSYTTPVLSSTKPYWVDASLNGCTTPTRTQVLALVYTPSVNTIAGAARCGVGSVTLGATGSGGIFWYAAPTGGSALYASSSPSSYTIPAISSTTTYYVEANINGCTTTRSAITATINAYPASQIIAGAGSTPFCSNSQNTGISYNTSPATCRISPNYPSGVSGSGGTGGQGWAVQFLSFTPVTTTTYYTLVGETYINGCTTSVNIPITVKPTPTLTLTGSSRCNTGTVTLNGSVNTGVINWYASTSEGAPSLGTGSSFTTPSISSTTPYYAIASLDGCSTAYQNVVATVVPPPSSASAGGDQSGCSATGYLYAQNPTTGTGLWTIINGGANTTIVSPNSYQTQVTNMMHGDNVFRWTVSNPPCSAVSDDTKITRVILGGCRIGMDEVMQEEEIQTFFGEVEIIPNPSENNFNMMIPSPDTKEVQIVISNVNGCTVQNDKLTTNTPYQFGEEFSAGIYAVKIIDGENIRTYKVVKIQ